MIKNENAWGVCVIVFPSTTVKYELRYLLSDELFITLRFFIVPDAKFNYFIIKREISDLLRYYDINFPSANYIFKYLKTTPRDGFKDVTWRNLRTVFFFPFH